MTAREPRIDIIRGFAILIILINHLTHVVEFTGLRHWMIPTPTRYGFSTAAELFVIMSGYMVGLVYLSRPRPMLAVWRRAGTLWLYNIVLLAIVLPLIAFMPAAELEFWRLGSFLENPVRSVWRFVTLRDAPRLLDVLLMYMKLMLLAPVAIQLHRWSPTLMIGVSVVLHIIGQYVTMRTLLASPDAHANWAFDLMRWQGLFFVPMGLGAMRLHKPLFAWLEGNWRAFATLLLLFVIGGMVRKLQVMELVAEPDWIAGRLGLGPTRVAHSILVLLLYASALTMGQRYLDRQPLRAIGSVGRHSLKCFAFGVIATYGLGVLWARAGGGMPLYYLFAAVGVLMTILLALRLDARAVKAKPSPAPRPAMATG